MTVGSDRGWWVVEEMVSGVNLREEVVHSEPGEECVAVWGVGAVRQGGWSWSELTKDVRAHLHLRSRPAKQSPRMQTRRGGGTVGRDCEGRWPP